MKSRILTVAAVIAAAGALAAFAPRTAPVAEAAPAPAAAPGAMKAYSVDGVHSSVVFRIKHNNVSWFWGRFDDVSGNFTLADGGAVEINIKPESVSTGNDRRDGHLRSPDFFSVKEFDKLGFKSKSMKQVSEGKYEATGDLTLRGVTKPLTVTIEKTGEGEARGASVVGFEAKFSINRSDFGMTYGMGGLSDEVQLIVSLQGAAK